MDGVQRDLLGQTVASKGVISILTQAQLDNTVFRTDYFNYIDSRHEGKAELRVINKFGHQFLNFLGQQ